MSVYGVWSGYVCLKKMMKKDDKVNDKRSNCAKPSNNNDNANEWEHDGCKDGVDDGCKDGCDGVQSGSGVDSVGVNEYVGAEYGYDTPGVFGRDGEGGSFLCGGQVVSCECVYDVW